MIAIIDYDAGNLKSVQKAFEYLGEKVIITRNQTDILKADKVVLPGVGAFQDAMEKILDFHLDEVIKKVIERKTPFLGICLGLQLLFESSEESKGAGLGILKGRVLHIPDTGLKVPHMGWNSLEFKPNSKTILFQGITENAFVYFVHSYYLKAQEDEIVTATTEYGVSIHAAIEKENIFACQFHPEKSGKVGLHILKNFAMIGKEGE